MSRLINADTGELRDFQPHQGDESYAKIAARQKGQAARRWGNRTLLAVIPDVNANPLLYGQRSARNSANLLSISDLGREYPISVQVRFAQLIPGTGAAALPFNDINPGIGDPLAPPVTLQLKIRRGVDPLATVTEDVYQMPNILNINAGIGINNFSDSAPFDVITARSLGLDIAIAQTANVAVQQLSNVWIEAIATIIDDVSASARLPGWGGAINTRFIAAAATTTTILRVRVCRSQFILTNTSTNANAYVAFSNQAILVPTPVATLVLPANQFARYESPIGGFTGYVTAIWDNATPNGGMLVTEGTSK